MASANGILAQTPVVPKNIGNIIRKGTRKINCLVSDKKIEVRAIPIERKKLVATIWNPTMGKIIKVTRSPKMERSISSWSVVNIRTITPGNNWQIRNPTTAIPTAQRIVNFVVSNTRL